MTGGIANTADEKFRRGIDADAVAFHDAFGVAEGFAQAVDDLLFVAHRWSPI